MTLGCDSSKPTEIPSIFLANEWACSFWNLIGIYNEDPNGKLKAEYASLAAML